MLSNKLIDLLQLNEEQQKLLKDAISKENILRRALRDCNVYPNMIEKIISGSDLSKIDPEDVEGLKEVIKQEWEEVIYSDEDKFRDYQAVKRIVAEKEKAEKEADFQKIREIKRKINF